jgi:hypothetical protein
MFSFNWFSSAPSEKPIEAAKVPAAKPAKTKDDYYAEIKVEMQKFAERKNTVENADFKRDTIGIGTVVLMLCTGYWLIPGVVGGVVYSQVKREPFKAAHDEQLRNLIRYYQLITQYGPAVTADRVFLDLLAMIQPHLGPEDKKILFPDEFNKPENLARLSDEYKEQLSQGPYPIPTSFNNEKEPARKANRCEKLNGIMPVRYQHYLTLFGDSADQLKMRLYQARYSLESKAPAAPASGLQIKLTV